MKTYLEPEEVRLLEDSATSLRDKLLVRLLFHIGCRVTEGLGLSVDDVNFESGQMTIQHLKTRLRLSCPECGGILGKSSLYCQRCGARVVETVSRELEHRRRRILPVDKKTLLMLKEHIDKGGPVSQGGRMVIFGISRHRAWQIVRQCADRAGLPNLVNPDTGKLHHVSPHRLRDAFAVHAMKQDDSGDGMRLLQQHLGHASFNTTARYRKVSGEEHREWYGRLWPEDTQDQQ